MREKLLKTVSKKKYEKINQLSFSYIFAETPPFDNAIIPLNFLVAHFRMSLIENSSCFYFLFEYCYAVNPTTIQNCQYQSFFYNSWTSLFFFDQRCS